MGRFLILILLLPLFLLFAGNDALCQDFPMLHYTVDDGLPSNNVYAIYRDSKGFLWIATDKGIARYNGLRFEIFTTDDGLPDNEIFLFREDPFGRLWLGTFNGELCYYKDGIFHTARNTAFLTIPSKKLYITGISIERDSSVTIRFYFNTNFINIKNDRITDIDLKKLDYKTDSRGLLFVNKLSDAAYALTYNDHIVTIDTFYKIKAAIPTGFTKDFGWEYVSIQNQRHLYFKGYIADSTVRIITYFHSCLKDHVYQAYYDQKNWFLLTSNGIIINDSVRILKENQASCLTQDKNGNYWATTLNDGIFVINKDFQNARLYKSVYKGKILYAKGLGNHIFYASSDHTVNQFSNGSSKCFFNFRDYLPLPPESASKPAFLVDSGDYFLCWSRGGYIEVDHLLSRTRRIKIHPDNLKHSETGKSFVRIDNDIYFNTGKRFLNINISDFISKKPAKYFSVADSLNEPRVFGAARGPDNSAWYSTIEGVYKVKNKRRTTQYWLKGIALKYFNFYGDFLAGYTHDNRLIIANVNDTAHIDFIPSENCLWNEFYRLDASHILISTSNLYRLLTLNPRGTGKKFSIATIENPFIPLGAEAICSDTAVCYFFKNGSVSCFKISSLFEHAHPPQLYFNFVRTRGKNYLIEDLVKLPYEESKNITVSFAALTFGNKNVSYQYAFSKNDHENWQNVKGEEINLVNPGYGSHTIKIRAKTLTSDFCTPIAFTLDIAKPYWATWWFVLIAAGTGLTLIGVIIRQRILVAFNRKEQRHNNEIKYLKSEYKALNALMNPHFIFNTLNNVQSLINKDEKLAANKYLRIFANLVRQNMHNISLEMISLSSELDIVNNYLTLEKLRFKEKLNYEITIEEGIEPEEIMIPPLLIQPLVENSIKHGILPKRSIEGVVRIEISEKDGMLIIAVKDNGIGIEAARNRTNNEHESYGLGNTRKRLAQLAIIQNKQISLTISDTKDEAGNLLWTIVSVSISIS